MRPIAGSTKSRTPSLNLRRINIEPDDPQITAPGDLVRQLTVTPAVDHADATVQPRRGEDVLC